MSRSKTYVLGVCIMVIYLAACGQAGTPEHPIPDDSLLTQEPCAPPCWQGLTPGQSTLDEAWTLLDNSTLVNRELTEHNNYSNVGSTLIWWWAGENLNYSRTNEFAFGTDYILRHIYITPNTNITIGDVIAVYGPPTLIFSRWNFQPEGGPNEGIISFARFTKYAFLVVWFEKLKNPNQAITYCPSVESTIYQIEYYTPGLAKTYEDQWRQEVSTIQEGVILEGGKVFSVENGQVQTSCLMMP